MKKRLISLACFVCILIRLPGLASCKENGTEPDTSVGESVAVTEMPGESTQVIITETAAPEVTTEPVSDDENSFVIMRSSKGESIEIFSEDYKEILSKRNETVKARCGLTVKEIISDDLKNAVGFGHLAGDEYEALILNALEEGTSLMCSGVLQDLGATGIDLSFASSSAIESLAKDLSYSGHMYLMPFKGLLSDISSSYVVTVKKGSSAEETLKSAYKENLYCLDTLYTIMKDFEDALDNYYDNGDESEPEPEGAFISGGEEAMEALLLGAGGRVLTTSEKIGSVPLSNLYESGFSSAFSAVSGIVTYVSDGDESISVVKLSDIDFENVIAFPMPPLNITAEYITPVDVRTLSVFAAPNGMIFGQKMVDLLETLASETIAVREQAQLLPGDADGSVSRFVFSSQHLETAKLFTWGELYEVAFDYLGPYGYSGLLATSDLSKRLAAAKSAAEIIRKRLDN